MGNEKSENLLTLSIQQEEPLRTLHLQKRRILPNEKVLHEGSQRLLKNCMEDGILGTS